VVKVYENYSLI